MRSNSMRISLLAILLMPLTTAFAQSDKDMIIASWKCVAVDHAVPVTTKKQKPTVPNAEIPNVDSLRRQQIGVVYGFRNNGTVIINKDGFYDALQYKVEGNVLTIKENTTYTIVELNYRQMVLGDSNSLLYMFERE